MALGVMIANVLAQIAPSMSKAAEIAPASGESIWRDGLDHMPEWLVDAVPKSAVGIGFTWLHIGLLLAGLFALCWLVIRFRTDRPKWSAGVRTIAERPISMRDALMVGGFMAFYVGLSIASQLKGEPENPVSIPQGQVVLGAAVTVLMFFMVLLFMPLTRKSGWKTAFGLRRESLARDIWVGVLFFLVGFLVVNVSGALVELVMEAMGHSMEAVPQEFARYMAEMTDPGLILATIVLTCLLVPFAEEAFFRGVLFPYTTQTLGLLAALVIVSLFFGIAHAVGSIIIPLSLLGGVFATAYVYSGSLTSSITAHVLFNLNSTLYLILVGIPATGA